MKLQPLLFATLAVFSAQAEDLVLGTLNSGITLQVIGDNDEDWVLQSSPDPTL